MKGKRLPASIRSILLNNDLASLLPLCHSLPTGRIYGHRLKTFLHLACKYSTSLSLLRHLIHTLHMNPHLPLPRTGVTCLHYACGRGSLRVVRFLVEEMGCDVDVRGPYGLKPLGVAVRFGREEVALWLLERTSRPLEPGRHYIPVIFRDTADTGGQSPTGPPTAAVYPSYPNSAGQGGPAAQTKVRTSPC